MGKSVYKVRFHQFCQTARLGSHGLVPARPTAYILCITTHFRGKFIINEITLFLKRNRNNNEEQVVLTCCLTGGIILHPFA